MEIKIKDKDKLVDATDDVAIYRTRNFNNLAEYELYPTKEELLKSL